MATLRACMAGAGTRSLHRRGCAPLLRFVDFRPFLLSRSTRKRVGKKHTKCSRRARSFARAHTHTHTLSLSLSLSSSWTTLQAHAALLAHNETQRNDILLFQVASSSTPRAHHATPRVYAKRASKQRHASLSGAAVPPSYMCTRSAAFHTPGITPSRPIPHLSLPCSVAAHR